ncbi:MAG: RIP metalloprotease RseP [candidate division WOR-3 bacterium]|nr:RIP metalloprotease RseP [candidate division WOR-3 bacterium]
MISPLLLVVIVIGSLIIVHEFGHLIFAKINRLPVEVFSIGFGPTIFKKKIGSTLYQISIIPLGGFIKLEGDEITSETGFNAAPLGKKSAVILAGPLFNLLLGFILTTILYAVFGVKTLEPRIIPEPNTTTAYVGFEKGDYILKVNQDTIKNWEDLQNKLSHLTEADITIKRNEEIKVINYKIPKDSFQFLPFIAPVVERVKAKSPAAQIGLKKGDEIIEVSGIPIKEWSSFVEIVQNSSGKKLFLKWRRGNQVLEDSIQPEAASEEISQKRIGMIGIWVKLPTKNLSLPVAISTAGLRTVYVFGQTFVIIYKIIAGKLPKSAIGGPVMVAKYTYEGAQWGPEYFIGLWALLSINLAVINIIPIPILDGGRVLLYIIERLKRRKLKKREWEIAFWIGYALIGIILVFALTNDVLRLIRIK